MPANNKCVGAAIVDDRRNQKAIDDLYLEGEKKRAKLEYAAKQQEPRTLGKYASLADGLWRSFLLGGDAFPLFRQGFVEPVGSIKEGIPQFFKALFSEDQRRLFDRDMRLDPDYQLSQRGETKLAILDGHEPYAQSETGMLAAARQAFPVLANLEGAFRTSLNAIRMYSFKKHINSMGGPAAWDSANLSELNKFINNGTGRGSLGGLESSASTLSKFMVGPRFFFSRLTYLTPLQLVKSAYAGNDMATKVMLISYAKQIAGIAAFTTLAEKAGKAAWGDDAVDFARSPLDPNFGRLRVGNTQIDITGGLGRPYRYATTLLAPQIAQATGIPTRKDPARGFARIVQGQLAPAPGALISAAEVYAGNADAKTEAQKYIVPWAYGDAVKAVQNEGLSKGTAISVINLFGGGSFTTERK